jgi:N-acetylmuramoyl-L-alanine amidase
MTLLEGLLWLTLNVYHEARSEPRVGQMAVAYVTLNRAMEKRVPVKEVITQPYQFSWTFQKDSYIPDDPDAFFQCMHSIYLALKTPDFTNGATHYHLDSITPHWASAYTYVAQFGSHKFYRPDDSKHAPENLYLSTPTLLLSSTYPAAKAEPLF